ncbi:hypothetical protein HY772_09765 [Candidatus Woesearchaeota archaeon]|nr:hypothetical protein [Candidatus Woesearchaeota archaeon]
MNAKITIHLEDGRVLEGVVVLHQTGNVKAIAGRNTPQRIHSLKKKKSKLAVCVDQLELQGYFTEKPVMTTPELLKALHLKCNKKLKEKNATRDLGKLVVEGTLQRDELPPGQGRPRGAQIWFLPSTDKKVIADYKKANAGSQK